MEPEGSSPYSQVPNTCPYPEPDRSSPCPPHPTSWRSILILSSHLYLRLPSGLFPSGFPTKTPYTPILSPKRATCPAHNILDLIALSLWYSLMRETRWTKAPSFGILRSAEWYSSLPTFRYNLSVPYSMVKQTKRNTGNILVRNSYWTAWPLKTGPDRLYRNVGKKLYHSALHKMPKIGQISFAQRRKPGNTRTFAHHI